MAVKRKFDKQWKNWLRTNTAAGCDKNDMFKILLDNGFEYKTICKQMKFEPRVPVHLLRNPLSDQQARTDQPKQKQETLDWSSLYIANADEHKQGSCKLHQLDDFLTEQERANINEEIGQFLTHSGDATDDSSQPIILTDLLNRDNSVAASLDHRLNRLMGFHPSYGDSLQAIHLKGQSESNDADHLTLEFDSRRELAHTLVICLNGSPDARFAMTDSDETQTLSPGTLAVWDYPKKLETAKLNREVQYQHETDKTALFLIKNFYRKSALNPAPKVYTKEANEYIHSYTKTGFVKTKLSDELFAKIKDFYNKNREKHAKEIIEGGYVYNAADQAKKSSTLVHLTEALKKEIHDTVVPLVAEWCGKELEPSYVYGIRVYRDKAVLKPHRDRIETHVLGVIINVDQEVNEDWPLIIDDHAYREHHILLKPGEMVFYESARLQHGRPIPFNGTSFANIFCHLRPKDYVLRK